MPALAVELRFPGGEVLTISAANVEEIRQYPIHQPDPVRVKIQSSTKSLARVYSFVSPIDLGRALETHWTARDTR